MMFEIYPNLFVGNCNDCFYHEKDGWAVIHACKSPCHQNILGYKGSLPQNHPNYLIYERPNHLFLNIIDPQEPLFKLPLFSRSLDFIDSHLPTQKVLVHCNNGLSRAPSIVLLFLAKRLKNIDNDDFMHAASDFKKLYPYYQPGRGILIYLSQNWQTLE